MNRKFLEDAIADAKTVKESAIANAKAVLEENFGPQIQSMLSAKIQEMADDEEAIEGYKCCQHEEDDGPNPAARHESTDLILCLAKEIIEWVVLLSPGIARFRSHKGISFYVTLGGTRDM